ncbi:MAG: hypothetical protein ACREDZ_00855 [Kiloniellales bacterium]
MKRLLLAAAFSLIFALPALAMHCPADMAKIDQALATNPSLSAEQLAEVQRLRAEGEVQHKAGNHQASMDTLAKAMSILGVQ